MVSSFSPLSSTTFSCSCRKLHIESSSGRSAHPSMRTARRPALVLLSMATVATGTPRGICTIESSESLPDSAVVLTGTPMTGTGVMAATMPGKCAAPPAPAMITLIPRSGADCANSYILAGVRCAETMVSSKGTPKRVNSSAAPFMTGRSESEPMMIDTSGAFGLAGTAGTRPWTILTRLRSSTAEVPTKVMCPIFLFFFTPSFPYQCTLAPSTARARLHMASASFKPSASSASPSMLSITAACTFILVLPSGMPMTARRWFSNWQQSEASMV
mmetsp:Transcript_48310/g.114089  ORF Transcript_48310/g.114089 Transcript_48310/m.114089 type:complete len:273 (-) Transcript_48310:904-1722(-)